MTHAMVYRLKYVAHQ